MVAAARWAAERRSRLPIFIASSYVAIVPPPGVRRLPTFRNKLDRLMNRRVAPPLRQARFRHGGDGEAALGVMRRVVEERQARAGQVLEIDDVQRAGALVEIVAVSGADRNRAASSAAAGLSPCAIRLGSCRRDARARSRVIAGKARAVTARPLSPPLGAKV